MDNKKMLNELRMNNVTMNKINSGNISLNICGNLELKIRALASVFPKNEWSGILFYKINKEESNKKNFENMVYDAIDVFPLDAGTSAYTNFEIDNIDLPIFMVNNGYDDDDDIFMGLIHSHPTFSTNASGTDYNTITKECCERGVFLSLIVNNEGTYSAYMSRLVKKNIKMECVKECTGFGGKIIKQNINKNEVMNQVECFTMKINRFYGLEDFIKDAKKLTPKQPEIKNPTNSFGIGSLFGDDMRSIGASMDMSTARKKYEVPEEIGFDAIRTCGIEYSESLNDFVHDFIVNNTRYESEKAFMSDVFSRINSHTDFGNLIKSISPKITKTSCGFDFTVFLLLSIIVIRIKNKSFGPAADMLLSFINKNESKYDCDFISKIHERATSYNLIKSIVKEYEDIKEDYKNLSIYNYILHVENGESFKCKNDVYESAIGFIDDMDDLNYTLSAEEFISLVAIAKWYKDKSMMNNLYKALPIILMSIDEDTDIDDIGINKTYTLFNTVYCMDNKGIKQSFVDMNIVNDCILNNFEFDNDSNPNENIEGADDIFELNSKIMAKIIMIYKEIDCDSKEIDNQAVYNMYNIL